jgi:hypothetical protein
MPPWIMTASVRPLMGSISLFSLIISYKGAALQNHVLVDPWLMTSSVIRSEILQDRQIAAHGSTPEILVYPKD